MCQVHFNYNTKQYNTMKCQSGERGTKQTKNQSQNQTQKINHQTPSLDGLYVLVGELIFLYFLYAFLL